MIRSIVILISLTLVMLCSLSLGGCVTTGTGSAVECGGGMFISYSAKADTPTTKRQIRVNNQLRKNLGCRNG